MLAYAANAPRHAERRSSPNAMLIVIAAHVAAIAAVMSAKMDLPTRMIDKPTVIEWIDPIEPPPPNEPARNPVRPQSGPTEGHRPPINPPVTDPFVPTDPATLDPGELTGGGTVGIPDALPPLKLVPVKFGPQLLTPASELKPPYPHSKLLSEEEALLKLRLTIDERGRVTAVEPVGRADPVFLKAARQYLLAHWRYRPASEDGRAVTSSTVITLRFTLEG
jgi:periplasmic protein TonB